ncbi:MAG: bacteriohemerythrin [Alcanivoracaceae bacterium]|nr:bacteriohemerythrin [Alcanivoracaceae bacterium]
MHALKWTSELEIGIPPIDKQHKRIVDYINQLEEIKGTTNREEVDNVLNQLVDYTLSHFAFEEELMEESGYMFVNAHKRVHKLFVRKVGVFVDRHKLGEDITLELLITLKTWLVNHIKNDDNDYSEVVKNKMHLKVKKSGWLKNSLKKFFG